MAFRIWIVSFALAAGCGSASRADVPPAGRAFYYWRTTFRLSAAERTALAAARATRLYVRMFDVQWNATESRAEFVGAIAAAEPAPAGIEVVPVVFLRQDVFAHLDGDHIRRLANATWAEVSRRAKPIGSAPRELQLDCDWTDTTRDRFFDYLRGVRAASRVQLSSTIRLHQVKYRERTGVPPVDRGMLMFYNMGTFSAQPGKRAIFDAEIAAKYLARVDDYPLPLDLALPIWSWTVQLRDDRVVDLLQSTDPDELPAIEFLRPAGDDRFVATRTAFLHGALLREGDVLKIERTTPADTLAALELATPHVTPGTISLFDLSERNLNRYATDQLEQLFSAR